MTTDPHAGFRDPTALTKWTKGFLYASLPLVLVGVVGSGRDYWWLSKHGQPAPGITLPVESIGGLIVALTALPMAAVGLIHRMQMANYRTQAAEVTDYE